MKVGLLIGVAMAVAGAAMSARAATIAIKDDSGSLDVLTPTLHTNNSLTNLYGTSPVVPAITQTSANSYQIDFSPTAGFNATAYALPAGETSTLDGSITILVTFPSAVQLTTSIFEDGVYRTTGTGTVDAYGGITVTALDATTLTKLPEFHGNSYFNPTFNTNGTWVLSDQVTGFTSSYSAYLIHVDNTLFAQALLTTPTADGLAWIAKKDFSLVLTTEGGGGKIPEPASLGVLALGSLALLARRRRA